MIKTLSYEEYGHNNNPTRSLLTNSVLCITRHGNVQVYKPGAKGHSSEIIIYMTDRNILSITEDPLDRQTLIDLYEQLKRAYISPKQHVVQITVNANGTYGCKVD